MRNNCQDTMECLWTLFKTLIRFIKLFQFRVDFPLFCVWRLTVFYVCGSYANISDMKTLYCSANCNHFCVNKGIHFQRNGQEIDMRNRSEQSVWAQPSHSKPLALLFIVLLQKYGIQIEYKQNLIRSEVWCNFESISQRMRTNKKCLSLFLICWFVSLENQDMTQIPLDDFWTITICVITASFKRHSYLRSKWVLVSQLHSLKMFICIDICFSWKWKMYDLCCENKWREVKQRSFIFS